MKLDSRNLVSLGVGVLIGGAIVGVGLFAFYKRT